MTCLAEGKMLDNLPHLTVPPEDSSADPQFDFLNEQSAKARPREKAPDIEKCFSMRVANWFVQTTDRSFAVVNMQGIFSLIGLDALDTSVCFEVREELASTIAYNDVDGACGSPVANRRCFLRTESFR
jgi:hypothetical protein